MMKRLILCIAVTLAVVSCGGGGSGSSPTAPTQQQSTPPPADPSDCVEVISKSWSDGSVSGRTDFVDVRYVLRNTCDQRIRFTGQGVFSQIIVEVYDNDSRSGSPLGTGYFDPFEIAAQTTATVEDLVILDRGSIDDIPSTEAIRMYFSVDFM